MSELPVVAVIGASVLDVVSEVDGFPEENSEVRALARHSGFGGNAANTAAVLASLGHKTHLVSALADDWVAGQIVRQLNHLGVDTSACRIHTGVETPASHILINRRTDSRSIVHFRGLPELDADALEALDLSTVDWCHFEGRSPAATAKMMASIRRRFPAIPCSLEIEKPRQDMDQLFEHTDVLLFSRAYAESLGFAAADPFLVAMASKTRVRPLVVAWGEQGACAMDDSDAMISSPAFPPDQTVDTLGAGDVFNAGVVHALAEGQSLSDALIAACQLAGHKCSHSGVV